MNILFVKHGDKYTYKNVNYLVEVLKLHIDGNYYCVTDDPAGVNCETIPCGPNLKVWWNKLWLFNLDLPGKNLYFDLDTKINGNPLPHLRWNGLTLVDCPWKDDIIINHNYDVKINSQVMTWTGQEQKHIWDHFITNADYFMRKYKGIDRFIVHEGIDHDTFSWDLIHSEKYSEYLGQPVTTFEELDATEGKVDLVVGTHKLLSNDIKFKDLGLLIVDEEHRFGVRQKEKMKAMRADVDILTLTATPIPRTLNMAMSGMRDLSIIATPPARRLAIKTFVRQSDDAVVREAVLREIMRGGQVYFLHNQVETIEKVAADLEKLIPEARVTVAHGQMRERELERIMNDFYHQRFNLLVCTTIIETGIDVPTANTIIMDRADNLGLAQLHQLRGRVGRSHHQAYAYLMTPHPKAMTKDAVKRLDAIASLEDLGAGFTLATHDLEIRGAGELLGDEQSGQIQSVGFTLYMEMLEQAVEALKEGKEPSLDELLREQTEVEMRLPALLPDDYIPDINTRLSMYKQIASVTSEDELGELKIELIDRFGLLPDATKNLLSVAKLKLQAAALKVKKIEAHDKGGFIEFYPDADINPMYLVKLLQSQPQKFAMDGPTKFKFTIPLVDRRKRIQFVSDMLGEFQQNLLPKA